MVEIIVDTNFLITCLKNKIDCICFFKEEFGKYQLVVAKEVFEELEKIFENKENKKEDRDLAKLSSNILQKNKTNSPILKTPNVDKGILDYIESRLKNNPEIKGKIYVATLDKELKKRIIKKFPLIRIINIQTSKKSLEIFRA